MKEHVGKGLGKGAVEKVVGELVEYRCRNATWHRAHVVAYRASGSGDLKTWLFHVEPLITLGCAGGMQVWVDVDDLRDPANRVIGADAVRLIAGLEIGRQGMEEGAGEAGTGERSIAVEDLIEGDVLDAPEWPYPVVFGVGPGFQDGWAEFVLRSGATWRLVYRRGSAL
jgi:hypothetical protein